MSRIRAFLADTDPGKRASVIDELLQSPEFTQYWTLQLAKLLRIRPQKDDGTGASVYHGWLAHQVAGEVSYKELARTLIMATGDSHEYGPANFYRTAGGPREQAEFMSELIMGSRLRCANCHNHPLDRWTQDDYHGLAAIFATIEGGQVVSEKPTGKVIHPRTLEPAIARIAAEGSRLNGRLDAGAQPLQIVNAFYLAALNRFPTADEQQHWESQLASLTTSDDQRAFLEDFVWGLLTCNEFVTNH